MIVHSSAASEASKSRWIDGSATFITVLSSITMKRAKHIAASAHHLALASLISFSRYRVTTKKIAS